MFVSESTAKFHVHNVMRKLGVRRRAEVAYAAGKLRSCPTCRAGDVG